MSQITVNYYATLRNTIGRKNDILKADTVEDVISQIQHNDIQVDKILKICSIFLNDSNVIHIDGVKTALKDGDEIHIFPPLGGG